MNSLKKAVLRTAVLAAVVCAVPSNAYAQQVLSDAGTGQPAYATVSAGAGLPALGDDLGVGIIALTALGVFCLIAAFLVLAHGIRSTKKQHPAVRGGTTRTRKP